MDIKNIEHNQRFHQFVQFLNSHFLIHGLRLLVDIVCVSTSSVFCSYYFKSNDERSISLARANVCKTFLSVISLNSRVERQCAFSTWWLAKIMDANADGEGAVMYRRGVCMLCGKMSWTATVGSLFESRVEQREVSSDCRAEGLEYESKNSNVFFFLVLFWFFFVYWCLENSHTHSPRSGPVSLAGFVTKPILPCRVSWKQYAVMWGTVNTSTLCVTVCINTCTTHSHTPLGKTDAAFKCGWKHNYEFSAHE